VFGVQPEAAAHIVYQSVDAPAGTQVLAMTDGFYRLVSPYGRYTDAQLIEAASARGLGPLMTDLRAQEASPEDDAKIGRFKTSDDATALLLEF
jgi:alpha-beta hydrolase superfamily lysophospholipase